MTSKNGDHENEWDRQEERCTATSTTAANQSNPRKRRRQDHPDEGGGGAGLTIKCRSKAPQTSSSELATTGQSLKSPSRPERKATSTLGKATTAAHQDIDDVVTSFLQRYVEDVPEAYSLDAIQELVYSQVTPSMYQRLLPVLTSCYHAAKIRKENAFLRNTRPKRTQEEERKERERIATIVQEFYEDVFFPHLFN